MKSILFSLAILLAMSFSLTGTGTETTGATESAPIRDFQMKNYFRAWQGVGADKENIYVTSDRDIKFRLSNTISVYDKNGRFLAEKTKAYTETDEQDRFMSFGDCYIFQGYLFVTAYNFNSGPPEEERTSRIVKYRLTDLGKVRDYEIGDGTAESLTFYKDSFWVVYHDKNKIKRFDTDFKLIDTYELNASFGSDGGYQGVFFIGDELYANLHGSNQYGQTYAQGLDHYHFDGEKFNYVKRIKPPTYGAGQGIEVVDNTIYWVDRPGNRIIITPNFY